MYSKGPVGGNARFGLLPSVLNLISVIFAILVIIGCTHNKPVLRTTYFLEVNSTDIVNLPGSIFDTLTEGAQHDLGIHDFYRYGLWGFCEGYNTTVVSCTNPKPGNSTNPVASINDEFTHDLHIPLPNTVEKDVHRLQTLSLFVFSCWIIGAVLGFGATIIGLILGCRVKVGSFIVGAFAFLSFVFILIGSVLCQVLYSALRDAMNAANFDIINIHTSLGTQMFAFVWTSCVTSGLALILWSADCCIGYRRQRRY